MYRLASQNVEGSKRKHLQLDVGEEMAFPDQLPLVLYIHSVHSVIKYELAWHLLFLLIPIPSNNKATRQACAKNSQLLLKEKGPLTYTVRSQGSTI